MERDEKTFNAALENGDKYVWIELKSGKIMYRSRTRYCRDIDPSCRGMFDMMTLSEYAWFTDKTRVTKVVTGADLYDKITWTRSGFVIDGERVPIPRQ